MKLLNYLLVLAVVAGCSEGRGKHESGRIAAGGYSVFYERTGSGAPILFLHAGLQDRSMWKEQVAALSNDFEVVTIDLPFHGATTGKDTGLLAKEVVRIVLDSLHIEKASIAGLSMGAAVAEDFIIAYPQRVNKAVLISAGINGFEKVFPPDSLTLSWYPRFLKRLESRDTAGAATEFARTWSEGIRSKSDSLTKSASRYVYQTTLANLKKFRLESWPNLQDAPSAFEQIKELKMPLLVIHGDEDLPFINATSEYLEKNIPGAKRVLIKGVAHMLNMEKPEEVNRIIRSFLQEK